MFIFVRMQEETGINITKSKEPSKWKGYAKNIVYILLALLVFLFALDLMISSLQHWGKSAAETILLATSNPFTALFIGLLITALIQSSTTTTSMVVVLVASGSLSLQSAVPIIMGANIGTTITSTIVSLGFIARKKEFIRAVSAGTYHDFFNILTVLILFPFEYYYGFLSDLSHYVASTFFNEPIEPVAGDFSLLGLGFTPVIQFLVSLINNGLILTLLSFGLLFGSILFFRKMITNMLGFGVPNRFQQFFFKNRLKSFGWGLTTTAVIRSSTITTSLVVPLVAKKVINLEAAIPFILGANVGTTLSAFIASVFNSNSGISIAIAHFLFNFIGILLFLFVPLFKGFPQYLAVQMGRITRKYRLAGFLYLLIIFFILPFSLIYLHPTDTGVSAFIYERVGSPDGTKSNYIITTREVNRQHESIWSIYHDMNESGNPSQIISVYRRSNILFVGNELFEFGIPGFCRKNNSGQESHQLCVEQIIPRYYASSSLVFDSVFVFKKYPIPYQDKRGAFQLFYVSPSENMILKKEIRDQQGLLVSESLIAVERR